MAKCVLGRTNNCGGGGLVQAFTSDHKRLFLNGYWIGRVGFIVILWGCCGCTVVRHHQKKEKQPRKSKCQVIHITILGSKGKMIKK